MIVMIKGSWYKVPECILTDKGLTLADACCFAYIAQRCDQSACELSTELIAAETGYSSRTVTTAVKRLAERSYIAVTAQQGKASIYRQMLLPPKRKSRSTRSQSVHDDIAKYNCVINQFLDPVEDPDAGKEVG